MSHKHILSIPELTDFSKVTELFALFAKKLVVLQKFLIPLELVGVREKFAERGASYSVAEFFGNTTRSIAVYA